MADAKELLLERAEELFYDEGFRAVGIDRLLAETGVAKATLYRHFPSKDDLLVAVLDRRDTRYRSWLSARTEALARTRAERVLAVFDALAERFAARAYRGCAFLNSMVEVADPRHPAHAAARRHKQAVTHWLATLLRDAGIVEPDALAAQLMLLMDGAVVTAVREQGPAAATRARALAAVLIADARSGRPRRPTPRSGIHPRQKRSAR